MTVFPNMPSAVVTALIAGLIMSPVASGQEKPGSPTKIDVSRLGPQVGQTIPNFSLPDQNGKTWTRATIMGPKGAMLLFYRSADWCPYCKTQLVDLQNRLSELRAKGLGVAAISYDPVPVLATFATRQHVEFPLLSDVGSSTIKAFGLLNPLPALAFAPGGDDPALVAELQKYVAGVRPNPSWVGIAFPGTFILDPRGRVVSRFFEDYYVERTTVSNVLLRLGNGLAPVAATQMAGDHVDVTSYASDSSVAAGNRFSLVLNIEPHKGVHVYAPGASGYKVIGLTVAPQPVLRVLPATYPASEMYVFKPLNERVQVFQKPFTLVQDVVLEGTPSAQAAYRGKPSITIEGTLEYQACDDRVCFNPVSMPLRWTVGVTPLVTGRPPR